MQRPAALYKYLPVTFRPRQQTGIQVHTSSPLRKPLCLSLPSGLCRSSRAPLRKAFLNPTLTELRFISAKREFTLCCPLLKSSSVSPPPPGSNKMFDCLPQGLGTCCSNCLDCCPYRTFLPHLLSHLPPAHLLKATAPTSIPTLLSSTGFVLVCHLYDLLPSRAVLSRAVAASHTWLLNADLIGFKCNKTYNSVSQPHRPRRRGLEASAAGDTNLGTHSRPKENAPAGADPHAGRLSCSLPSPWTRTR